MPFAQGAPAVPGPLRYELLGPLRVVDEHGEHSPSAYKVRLLLATLLGRAGQVVTMEQLVEAVWGDRAPTRASANVHVYVSQLRKFLHRDGVTQTPIATQPPGYRITVAPESMDQFRFRRLVQEGRGHARAARHEDAATAFGAALSLWRGPALEGLRDSAPLDTLASRLDEDRLECIELLAESALALGQHRELIGLLYAAIDENPLREPFYRQLMLALFRSERQAEALQLYQLARRTVSDALGVEPCRSLRELHQAILEDDDRLYLRTGA
ncbi:AfsR/SARP family transcriptional regulator [Kitasatospora sp. NPDC036755]|uniref:AfsR/SARP family transcriptional regulator n=1 Tax=Kitasatospora sp. NPDC036755 TaxID=3154600 RepID=UPI0033CC658A